MSLNRKFAHSLLIRDLLVEKTRNYQLQHFLLARRESIDSRANSPYFRRTLPQLTVAGNRFLNGVQQILTANRLRQELIRTFFHGAHRHRDVAMTGNEDNRNLNIGRAQLELKIEAAQPRHPYVENKTGWRFLSLCHQKVLC